MPSPCRSTAPPDIADLGTVPSIAGLRPGLRRPPLRDVAEGRGLARDGHRRGRQAAGRLLHPLQQHAGGGREGASRRLGLERSRRPHLQLRVGHRRRRQDRRPRRDVRRQLPERRCTCHHAHRDRHRGRALLAHAAGVRRRARRRRRARASDVTRLRATLSATEPAEARSSCASAACSSASAATRPPPGRSPPRCGTPARLHAARLQPGQRAAREQDVQGSHGQRHRAPAHPGARAGRHADADRSACRRSVQAGGKSVQRSVLVRVGA